MKDLDIDQANAAKISPPSYRLWGEIAPARGWCARMRGSDGDTRSVPIVGFVMGNLVRLHESDGQCVELTGDAEVVGILPDPSMPTRMLAAPLVAGFEGYEPVREAPSW
jgi:hypothetical protein